MKINWKDFAVMYLLAILIMVLAVTVLMSINNLPVRIITQNVIFVVPGVYYFYKNRSSLTEASVISTLFGFTVFPVCVLTLFIYVLLRGDPLSSILVIFQASDWIANIAALMAIGVFVTILTVISWLINQYLLSKPPVASSQSSKPKRGSK